MKKLVLVGGGGHCKSVIDSIKSLGDFEIVGITDPLKKGIVSGVNIIGDDSELENVYKLGVNYAFITLGSIGNPIKRICIYNNLKKIGFDIPVIIDKSAIIAEYCNIGEGTFVGKRAVINSQTRIGNNTIINTAAIIEHDCIVRDYVHIAPGAVLSGNVYVGENSHIGANATIIEGIKIGSNTIVGAGSVIVKSFGNNLKIYGNPGRGKV